MHLVTRMLGLPLLGSVGVAIRQIMSFFSYYQPPRLTLIPKRPARITAGVSGKIAAIMVLTGYRAPRTLVKMGSTSTNVEFCENRAVSGFRWNVWLRIFYSFVLFKSVVISSSFSKSVVMVLGATFLGITFFTRTFFTAVFFVEPFWVDFFSGT